MKRQARGRRVLLLMALLCLLPVLSAWAVFRLAPSLPRHSYGQLLPAGPFAAAAQPDWPLGRWSLVSVETVPCAAACQQRRFLLQQIPPTQGEAAQRMVALRLVPASGQGRAPGLLSLPAPAVALATNGLYLVDPHGNQVLFYPDGSDPSRMISEINRVLQVNNAL